MDTEGDLTEGSLPNEFHELVVLKCSRRQLVVLLDIGFNELYQSVALLKNCLIDFSCIIHARITCNLHVTRICVTVSSDTSGNASSQGIATAKVSEAISDAHIQANAGCPAATDQASSLFYYIIVGVT